MEHLISLTPERSSSLEKTPDKEMPFSTENVASTSPGIAHPSEAAPIVQLSLSALQCVSISPERYSTPEETPTAHSLTSAKSIGTVNTITESIAVTKTQENKTGAPNRFSLGQNKHTPVKPRGAIAVDNGTVDRSPAHVGKEERSKLVLRWPTIIPDRSNPGQFISGPESQYTYPQAVDWNSKDNIRAINAWREQLFRRNFGEARKAREKYVEREREAILRLAEVQLQKRNALDYNALANEYNKKYYLKGVIHRIGERQVAEGKNHSVAYLKEDRIAPWRTAAALAGQFTKWPKAINLLDDARHRAEKKGARGESIMDPAGENEIPDPNPHPFSPLKRKTDDARISSPSNALRKRFRIQNGEKIELGMDGKVLMHDEGIDIAESGKSMFDVNAFGPPAETNKSSKTRLLSTAFGTSHDLDDARGDATQSATSREVLTEEGEVETAGDRGDKRMDDIYGA